MNYNRIYQQIIQKAKEDQENRILLHKNKTAYFEGHHIIPMCFGGKGSSQTWKNRLIENRHTNIVGLTPKEHFICHMLLTKIYPGNKKMIYAFWKMCAKQNSKQVRHIPSASSYEIARQLFISIPSIRKGTKCSIATKNKMKLSGKGKHTGNKNASYGCVWITLLQERKRIKKEFLQSYMDLGWSPSKQYFRNERNKSTGDSLG